ncbi:MAG: hypothetical protein NTY64_10900 [Deltaproteobacteria bacterium]|nr:hypothetical protein [Deltaproteobacteria bacterium]
MSITDHPSPITVFKRRSAVSRSLPAEAAADRVLFGGNIITVDPAKPKAQAAAIKDGKLLKVGNDAEVLALSGRKTQKIPLRGRTVTPGFNDSHQHLSHVAANLLKLDCSPVVCRSIGNAFSTALTWMPQLLNIRSSSNTSAAIGP